MLPGPHARTPKQGPRRGQRWSQCVTIDDGGIVSASPGGQSVQEEYDDGVEANVHDANRRYLQLCKTCLFALGLFTFFGGLLVVA
eukprot:5854653-Prymnesium_polylepis.1